MFELIGREREQSALCSALERARSQSGSLVLVSGEAGIGKTSLVNAFLESVRNEDVCVLRGACYDMVTTPPYGPWFELLHTRTLSVDDPKLPQFVQDASALSDLQSREELFAQALGYFAELSEKQPVVLVLEDMHWSDEASLNLLRFVARRLSGHRILLIVTYRDDEFSRDHPLYLLLPHLVREAHPVRINLQSFGTDEIRQLVTHLYPQSDSDLDATVRYLQQHAAGNPLFILESLRQLELQGNLRQVSGSWELQAPDESKVPDLIQQIVEGRLARVSQATVSMVQTASAISQRVSLAILEQLLDDEQIDIALDEAANTWLLDVHPTSQDVSFRHALVRTAVYETTSRAQRKCLHRRIADLHLEQMEPDPETISWHLRQAGDLRAAEWLIRAGEEADQTFASYEAFARYSDALLLLEEGAGDESTRAGLLLKMGRSLRFFDPERGNEFLQAAYEAASDCGEQAIAATALFNHGNNLVNLAEVKRGLSYMQHAVAIMLEIPDEVVEVGRWTHNVSLPRDPLYTMNGSLALLLATTGRFQAAVTTAERLIDFDWRVLAKSGESPDDTGAKRLEVDGLYGLGMALAALGKPEDSKLAFSLADGILARIDYVPYRVLVASNELLSHHFPFDTDNLAGRQRLIGLIENHLQDSEGLVGYQNALWGYEHFLVHSGKWNELRSLVETYEPSNLFDYWFTSLSAHARLAWYEGDMERAREILAEILIDGPDTPPDEQTFFIPAEPHRIAAGIAIEDGDTELARSWMVAHDHWLDWSESVPGRAEGLLLWARIHLAERSTDEARELAHQSRQQAEAPRQPMALIAIHRFLGELASSTNDLDAAAEHLETSLALARNCQLPFETAQSLLSLAELEIARGDDSGARNVLSQVQQINADLDARPVLDRARKLEGTLHTGRTECPFGLSEREREVLALVAEGLTDRQIAERLFISHRTVMRHVASILRKLDVESRTAAATKAVSSGLC